MLNITAGMDQKDSFMRGFWWRSTGAALRRGCRGALRCRVVVIASLLIVLKVMHGTALSR